MARDREVTFYTDETTVTDLDELADERDQTRSSLVDELVRDGLRREHEGDVSAETRAAERLQEILDDGLQEMQTIARQIQDLNAKNGAYSAANFELIKRGIGDAERKKALQTGARRMRADDPIGDALDDDAATDDDSDDDSGFYDDLREGQ